MSNDGAVPYIDLSVASAIHIVGIGGAGMSAIAAVLAAMGHRVSGSDLKDSATLARLRALGVAVQIGHDGANLGAARYLSISSAIAPSNPEVLAARERQIPVLTRAQLLAAITALRSTIAISGTHGKTTTSSMLALILAEGGLSPSFIVGGELNEIGSNAAWGSGEWLVVEADESDGTFLRLESQYSLVTSVEADHLDHYGSMESLSEAFAIFLADAQRRSFVCADDRLASSLAPWDAITYGFSEAAQLKIVDFRGGRSDIAFGIEREGVELGRFVLPVPGAHNALNAAAAIAVSSTLGVGIPAQQAALARFAGVARRFQFRGERNEISFVDDYAHLPGEVTAALAAARLGGFSRIVCVFQPHRYSRIANIAPLFADAFLGADVVVLTDIYPAGEAPRPGVSSKLVLDAVLRQHPETNLSYLAGRPELVEFLKGELRAGDLCLSLGAGDLTTLAEQLLGDPSW